MDSQQAKKVLALHRPGSQDAADPQMSEALEAARQDPELGAWLEQQTAVHKAIRETLRGIPVPQDLQRDIWMRHTDRKSVLRLARPALVPLAAAVCVLIGFFVWRHFNRRENTFARYREHVARMVQRRAYFTSVVTGNLSQVDDYFHTNSAPDSANLPATIANLPLEGATIVQWENHPVSVLCLDGREKDAGEKNDLWLFTTDQNNIPDTPKKIASEYQEIGRMMTVTWTREGRLYVLVGQGDEKALQKYLE